MTRTHKLGAISGAVAPAGFVFILATVGALPALPFAVATLFLGRRYLPRFWLTLGIGLASGVMAGVLILGPGFRLAMRVVAILEPLQSPEFTIGGTLMIVVVVGAIGGGLFGIAGAMLARVAPGWSVHALTVIGVMGFLMSNPALREEILELGSGPLLNISMFATAGFLYSVLAGVLRRRFEKGTVPVDAETAGVAA